MNIDVYIPYNKEKKLGF